MKVHDYTFQCLNKNNPCKVLFSVSTNNVLSFPMLYLKIFLNGSLFPDNSFHPSYDQLCTNIISYVAIICWNKVSSLIAAEAMT